MAVKSERNFNVTGAVVKAVIGERAIINVRWQDAEACGIQVPNEMKISDLVTMCTSSVQRIFKEENCTTIVTSNSVYNVYPLDYTVSA